MEEKRFLDESGLVRFYEKLKEKLDNAENAARLYLHVLSFNQPISSVEGEPFSETKLLVITTSEEPCTTERGALGEGSYILYNLDLCFPLSDIISVFGAYGAYYGHHLLPADVILGRASDISYIQQAVIKPTTALGGKYEGRTTPEVVLDQSKYIGDTVIEI